MNIEFCIFELVWVSNFPLSKQFWIIGPNSPKKGIYNLKQTTKKLKITFKICIFLFKFAQKGFIRSKTKSKKKKKKKKNKIKI